MTSPAVREALAASGARFVGGAEEVASFGDVGREAGALRGGAGAYPRLDLATWEASGAQALDFLHRMTSQDLRTLSAGHVRPALVLTREGRVLGDPVVWGLGDRARLVLAAAARAAIPALERYVIADDVAFADRTEASAVATLAGPTAPEVLARALGADAPAAGRFVRVPFGGAEALVARRDLGPRPAFDLAVDADRLADALAALVRAGASPVGGAAWDVARVETGTPAWGAELDDRVLPNEAGLEASISWTKGCYLGQEPVVMAAHRGHPPSLLCRLRVDGPPPARDAELLAEGRRAGRVTTAIAEPAVPGSTALGYVRWDLAEPSARLSLADGAGVVVTAPLVPKRP